MSYPSPQDPWRGQAPPPVVPGFAAPDETSVQPDSRKRRPLALMIVGGAVGLTLLCCGGFAVIGAEVRAAGKAPLRRGQPGYRGGLDTDGDGVACETESASTTKPTKKPTTKPSPKPRDDPRFATCKAAIAAGYGPYYRGQDPEYAWYRDADGDGRVCER